MMKSEHNSFPYNDTEWNNIVNDAFTSDAQPHVFSERYARRKQQMLHQMEESPMRSHKFHMKKSLTAAVAVAAAIVVIPTAVYASTQIRGYFQNGGGEYQQEMVIPKNDSVSDQIMALQVGWMPEDMATDPSSGKYRDPSGRAISMFFYKIDSQEAALTHTVNYSVSQETLTCGSNTVLYAVTDTTGLSGKDVFDKDVWVAFPDSNYAVQLYATTGVTKEEIEKIAENLSLTPSDKETASCGAVSRRKRLAEPMRFTRSMTIPFSRSVTPFVRISMMMMTDIPASLSSWTAFPSRITLTDFRQWMKSAIRQTTASISMRTALSRTMYAHGTPAATA